MDLDAYLKRIDFRGKLNADTATLARLMQAHLRAIPFENIDVQLGVPVSTKPEDAFVKLVERGRGGWCFEQNGLFKWVLGESGFKVQSLAGYVGRVEADPPTESSHLFLRVDCPEPLFVDVGFGGSLIAPIPLGPCRVEQTPYIHTIARADGAFYRWQENAHGAVSSLDFTLTPVGSQHFDATSHWLQSDPNSPFVRTLTAQMRYPNKHVILRGLVKRTIDPNGVSDRVLRSSDELVGCMKEEFDLDVPELSDCWERLRERHEEVVK